jgi:hypothetical protein
VQAKARQRVADLDMAARLEEIWLEAIDVSAEPAEIAAALHAAFREYGCDPTGLNDAEAAERVGGRLVTPELVAGLDHWARIQRRLGGRDDPLAAKLRAVATTADPDPWRKRVRDVVLDGTPDDTAALATEIPVGAAPPDALHWLGNSLLQAGRLAEWEALLRRAARAHPGNVRLNHQLGEKLRSIGGSQAMSASAKIVADANALYVPGWYFRTIDFSRNTGVSNAQDTLTSSDGVFVAKYNLTNGSLAWGRGVGGSAGGSSVAVDDGMVYVGGTFTQTVDFDPAHAYADTRDVLTSRGSADGFNLQLDTSGAYVNA